MDAAGSKRAAVMGLSEGGSLATLFAGTHPERCSALILYGAFAHFSDWFPTRQKFDAFISYVDTSWGSGTSFRIFRPVQERQRRLSALVGPMGKAGRQPVSGAEPDANEQRNQYRWHPALDPRAYIGPSPATRAANAGATVAQLEAIFGWQGGSMAALYTRAADRRRLSIEAMSKLENDKRTSIVAPLYEVRHLGEKGK
jgi:pimeloyl-ACP methyl ester carboxylesterase